MFARIKMPRRPRRQITWVPKRDSMSLCLRESWRNRTKRHRTIDNKKAPNTELEKSDGGPSGIRTLDLGIKSPLL